MEEVSREDLFLESKFFVKKETDAYAEVISAEPLDLAQTENLSRLLGKSVYLVGTDAALVEKTFEKTIYSKSSKSGRAARSLRGGEGLKVSSESIQVNYNDAPIVQLVNSLLEEAVKRGASDIHIEPFENEMTTSFRIHGKLQATLRSPAAYFPAVSIRIKYLSKLDVTEKMLPQDGKARLEVGGETLDLRISTVPTKTGESIVIRLLRKNVDYIDIAKVGFRKEDEKSLRKILAGSGGLIISTGPTGSGKSTTLYSMMKTLNDGKTKILSIEDPVEYQMEGINQVEVNEAQGVTFATMLKRFLRQDPDVIMVGEIRDEETARIAVQASLTGHLVLTTLHTQDSFGAITRLIDLGVEPYQIASSLKLILAQRLLPTLCPKCKKKVGTKKSLGYDAKGCKSCEGTGRAGRTGIIEYLEMTKEIQDLLDGKDAEKRVRSLVTGKGKSKKETFESLETLGMEKVLQGDVSLADLKSSL